MDNTTKKINPIELGLEPANKDEYFIPMANYKKNNTRLWYNSDSTISRYLISNMGRIYSIPKSKIINHIQKGKWNNLYVSIYTDTSISDKLSVAKLMVYNFDRDNFNQSTHYTILDINDFVTLDNFVPRVAIKFDLSKDEIEFIRSNLKAGFTIRDILNKRPSLKGCKNSKYSRMKEYDPDISETIMDILDNITSDQFYDECNKRIPYKKLFKEVLTKNGIKFDKTTGLEYTANFIECCRRYVAGDVTTIRIRRKLI